MADNPNLIALPEEKPLALATGFLRAFSSRPLAKTRHWAGARTCAGDCSTDWPAAAFLPRLDQFFSVRGGDITREAHTTHPRPPISLLGTDGQRTLQIPLQALPMNGGAAAKRKSSSRRVLAIERPTQLPDIPDHHTSV